MGVINLQIDTPSAENRPEQILSSTSAPSGIKIEAKHWLVRYDSKRDTQRSLLDAAATDVMYREFAKIHAMHTYGPSDRRSHEDTQMIKKQFSKEKPQQLAQTISQTDSAWDKTVH